MAWDTTILSTPESIARYEKEINTITEAAVERVLYNEEVGEGTWSNEILTATGYDISTLRGFGKLTVTATNVIENKITLKLFDSEDDDTYTDTGLHLLIPISESYEFTYLLPLTINDYVKIYASKGATVEADNLNITVKSAWADKHTVAKQIIGQHLFSYIGDALDDLDNPTELCTPADYLTLHLIYADLVLGFGENEIYSGKMKFYYTRFQQTLKLALRRLLNDGDKLAPGGYISR